VVLEALVQRLDRLLVRLLDAAVIALAGLLLILLNYAVYTRFVLNDSVSWSEELPAHILAVLTFIGAAYLTRTNEHLGFDSVVRLLPPALQKLVLGTNLVVMAAFGCLFAWYGAIAAMSFRGRMLISIDLPMELFRAALPLGAALIALFCVVRLVGLLTGRIGVADLLPETDA
jgi:TRAP-type C4-dicarboxylate transport system permease small subunit